MHPKLLGVFPAYGVFLLLGDLAGIGLAFYCARQAKLPLRRFALFLLILTIAALGGAKLYGLIEREGRVGPLSYEAFAGYRYPGGVLGFALGLWSLTRSRFSQIRAGILADVVAPSFGVAMAISRIGCLLAGCCVGKVCALPWAIRFPHASQPWNTQRRMGLIESDALLSLPVHPLEIYFALLSISIAVVLLWFQRRKAYDGQVFLLYLCLQGGGQFGLEFFRFTPLPHVQYLSLLFLIVGGSLLLMKARFVRAGATESLSPPLRKG